MKYFNNVPDLSELRRQYKELLKKHHPDNGSNVDGIEILICGQWIWVSGNTFQHKKELKEFGFKWASQKKMWHWHSEMFRKKSRKSLSMDDIKSYYGNTEIKPTQRKLLEA